MIRADALMKPLLIFALAALLSAPSLAAGPTAPAKGDVAKGQALANQVCMACHGADGNSMTPENPKLAGQHPEYLVKQLHEYKSGKRANAIMQGFAAQLSDEDMLNLASYFASQPLALGAARNRELVQLGERIYRGGIQDRQIPACAGCHGPAGWGIPSQYPRLNGQHSGYTEAQLRAFRSGERRNNTQMTAIAAHMSDREIQAVADYIAGLR